MRVGADSRSGVDENFEGVWIEDVAGLFRTNIVAFERRHFVEIGGDRVEQ